jgi:hypothetical protein
LERPTAFLLSPKDGVTVYLNPFFLLAFIDTDIELIVQDNDQERRNYKVIQKSFSVKWSVLV